MNQKYVKNISDYENKYDWVFNSLVEVKLKKPEDFLKVKETLTRMGIASRRTQNTLFQSCHILHKKMPVDGDMTKRESKYYLCHFKELFTLDGKQSTLIDEDVIRRNKIARMLSEWNLVEVVNEEECNKTRNEICSVKIVSYREKKNWQLVAKYQIGKKK